MDRIHFWNTTGSYCRALNVAQFPLWQKARKTNFCRGCISAAVTRYNEIIHQPKARADNNRYYVDQVLLFRIRRGLIDVR